MNRREALRWLGLGAAAAAGRLQAAPDLSVQVFFTPAYVGAAHAFETTRKARWVADSLAREPLPRISLRPNKPLTQADLLRVHSAAYINAVRTGEPRALAESQGFAWDPQLWPMVLASNGGVLAAAAAALADGVAGSLSSGLHHARRDRGAGFCTFNGLAVAALHALDRGAKRVLILDLDAHCGGGTHAVLGRHPAVRQLDVAVDAFDHYQPAGANTLDMVGTAAHYLPAIRRRLAALAGERFDLCLYNAGMDPHQFCPVGGLAGIGSAILAQRERMVFSWCRARSLPVAFVLAGGYISPRLDAAALVGLHRLTLRAAATS